MMTTSNAEKQIIEALTVVERLQEKQLLVVKKKGKEPSNMNSIPTKNYKVKETKKVSSMNLANSHWR